MKNTRNRVKTNQLKIKLKAILLLTLALWGVSLLTKPVSLTKKTHTIKLSQKHLIASVKAESTHPTNIPITPTSTETPTPVLTTAPTESGYCLTVPVIFYHHIQPEVQAQTKKQTSLSVDNGIFDQQMAYILSHGYTPITSEQLVNALATHTQLPGKSIVVTVDDAYEDFYTFAFPIIQKYHIPISLLVPTGLLEGSDYLHWSQIDELKRSGLVYFVDHTWSHYSLPNGTDDKITYEIQTAKKQLEDHTGQQITIFGYPYGSFNNASIEILRQLGFKGAFTTLPGSYQCDSFIMTLHRTRIGNSSLSSYGL